MRILLCDDEKAQLELLKKAVESYFDEKQIPYRIDTYLNAEQLLMDWDKDEIADLALLDIQMGEMDGVELAKRLRCINPAMSILFITAMTDYIYESFQLNAINYLLKPFDNNKLYACLDQAVELMNRDNSLLIQCDKELIKIELDDLIRIESNGHYLRLITQNQTYSIKKSMKEMSDELPSSFYRLSRSDLISLKAIKRITSKEVMMLNGDSLLIPKGRHREMSDAFVQYHFHGGKSEWN